MGLLDWLTSDIGGGMGGMPPMNPMGDAMGAPAAAMPAPPMQAAPPVSPPISGPQTGLNYPPPPPSPPISGPQTGLPMPPGTDPMTAGGVTPQSDLSSLPQPPLPGGSDPMTAGGMTPNGPGISKPPPLSTLPATDISSSNTRNEPGAPLDLTSAVKSYQAAGGNFKPQEGQEGPTSVIGRALGLNANTERSLRGTLGAGFKAAGDSAGKSPFQALSSGVGAGIEGGQKAEDKGYDQRLASLKLAVDAKAKGDNETYKLNYLKYLGESLKNDKANAATKASGKSNAWNKPDSQKFIDAQNAVSKDPEVRGALKTLEAAQRAGDPKEIAAAQAGLTSITQRKGSEFMNAMGIDPKKVQSLAQNPAGSRENPHEITSQSDFDTYVKPGQAYKNPADGKVYIRKGDQSSATPVQPGAPSTAAAPAPAPDASSDDE